MNCNAGLRLGVPMAAALAICTLYSCEPRVEEVTIPQKSLPKVANDVWDAVANDDAEAIRKYAEAGGDVNIQEGGPAGVYEPGAYPLFVALHEHKPKTYKALLELGANPNIIFGQGRVVTNYAAAEEDPTWLQLALEHGGDPNLDNAASHPTHRGTPLKFAINQNLIENVKLLVKHGADINLINHFGDHPLSLALERGKYEIVLYLLDQGSNYTATNPQWPEMSFLERLRSADVDKYRVAKDRNGYWAIRKWLKERGVDAGPVPADVEQ